MMVDEYDPPYPTPLKFSWNEATKTFNIPKLGSEYACKLNSADMQYPLTS